VRSLSMVQVQAVAQDIVTALSSADVQEAEFDVLIAPFIAELDQWTSLQRLVLVTMATAGVARYASEVQCLRLRSMKAEVCLHDLHRELTHNLVQVEQAILDTCEN
jgi:hypothetical protein